MKRLATATGLALFALGLTAGVASADCMSNKLTMASTASEQPAPLPVDVATLETGTATTQR